VVRLSFYPTESHNGYLEVINDLGIAGGACLIAYLVVFLRHALALMKTDRMQGGLYLAILFQQFLGNLSEAQFLATGGMQGAMMTIATISLARDRLQARRAALHG
jgi:O-antigen ligase